MVKHIAIGGFQHETNSFSPVKATYEDFVKADGWPPLARGKELFTETEGIHLPITGASEYLQTQGAECHPLVWASAVPSAHVTEDAFERVAAMFLEDLSALQGAIDGIYLDLHGAMICEHVQDGEGELLKRIRDLVGDLPLTISLDLHANITPEMVEFCDYIDVFRTYPHVDMGASGQRAAAVLLRILQGEARPQKAFRQADFVIPLCDGCTLFGAAKDFYESDLQAVLEEGVAASAACGFPLSDIYHMGPSVVTYADTQDAADAAADQLMEKMRARFVGNTSEYFSPADAVSEAMQASEFPIVIADVQDNPGGGGTGDTTGMLRALLEAKVDSAVIACFYEPELAEQLHTHKVGDNVTVALGGRRFDGDSPYSGEAEIVALTDGIFTGTGPMWKGARMQLGPMAVIKIGGVRVIIQSQNQQAADTSILRHVGIEPAAEKIIVLKSSVHYRADFQPIGKKILSALAPGAVYADVKNLPFQNLRPNIKIN